MSEALNSEIFKIENKHNGKVYIGKADNAFKKWSNYKYFLERGELFNKMIQGDYNLYGGMGAFEYSFIESCRSEDVDKRQTFYIKKFGSDENSGYNSREAYNDDCSVRKEVTVSRKQFEQLCEKVKSSDWSTYLYLRFNSDNNNKITLNKSTLAEYLKTSYGTVLKHIQSLIDSGVIKETGKEGTHSVYEIV